MPNIQLNLSKPSSTISKILMFPLNFVPKEIPLKLPHRKFQMHILLDLEETFQNATSASVEDIM
eukprot:scaffold258593_cov24-Attheya_sp.AAC.1